MQIDVTHRGGKFFLKEKLKIRRDNVPGTLVNPRVMRVKIMGQYLYNKEKSTEPMNRNNPNLGSM